MEILKLTPGEMAFEDTDCIKIKETSDATFSLVASALMAGGDGDNVGFVALVASDPYISYEAAETARLTWAEHDFNFALLPHDLFGLVLLGRHSSSLP